MRQIFILFLFVFNWSTSQNKEVIDSLNNISNNQDKLDYLATVIPTQLYSSSENVMYYAQQFDSIAKLENTIGNQVNALNFKGMAHFVSYDYEPAIRFYLEAIQVLEKQEPGQKLSRIYNNLAACYNIRKDFNNTEKYFLMSLNIAKTIEDMPWVANINNNISILYMQNKMYDKAEKSIDNALSYYKQENDSVMMGIAYMNYGNSKLFNKNFDDAITYYKQSLIYVKMDQVPTVHAVAKTGIGIGLTKAQNYTEALPYLKEGVEIAKLIKHDEQLMESYKALAEYYAVTKNHKDAYDLLKVSQSLKDSIISNEQDQNMANALTRFESDKKDAELKLLKVEAEKKEREKQLYSTLAIAGLLIATLLGFFVYSNRKKNNILAKQKALLEKTVDEKNTLLKEVHHRVKNSFQIVSSLLYLQSENVTDQKAKLAIKEAENRVRSMVLVHQKLYNKDELVGINSKEYITDLVKDILDSHQVQKEPIEYHLNIDPLVLDIETMTPLGLILNELIINTMKHAFKGIEHNNKINIDFTKFNDELILKVTDNGKGFKGDIKQTSFGITLMKALSKQLKAKLDYSSKPSEGTQAILRITKFNILS